VGCRPLAEPSSFILALNRRREPYEAACGGVGIVRALYFGNKCLLLHSRKHCSRVISEDQILVEVRFTDLEYT